MNHCLLKSLNTEITKILMKINPGVYSKKVYDFNTDDITVDIFKMTFLNVPNKFALLKKKYQRANHSRFVNKELNKAIMQR